MRPRALRPRALHPAPIAALLAAASCGGPVEAPGPVPASLHRLTERQLNRSLAELFGDDTLPQLDLPPEVRVHGFDNNTLTRAPTPYLVEQLRGGLSEVAAAAVSTGGPWLLCEPGGGDDPLGCGQDTLEALLPRAWRRPLSEAEEAEIVGFFEELLPELGFDGALQLSLEATLLSPEHLYLVERGAVDPDAPDRLRLDDWSMASRLSFLFWDSMPDEALFEAAAAGELGTAREVRDQAARMLTTPDGRNTVARMHGQWLGLEALEDAAPDLELYAATFAEDSWALWQTWLERGDASALLYAERYWFGAQIDLRNDLDDEFELVLEHVLFGEGTLEALLTTRRGYVTELTAPIYGVSVPEDGEPERGRLYAVDLPSGERSGVLTLGGFLAAHGHATHPSPVLRGAFIRERLLCDPPSAPPAETPSLEDASPEGWVTNRERYDAMVADEPCAGCHAPLHGVGYALEAYDTLGLWRFEDNGATVDRSGELMGTDVDGPVEGPLQLMQALAQSRQVHDCLVTQVWRYGMHRSELEVDEAALAAMQEAFWSDGGVIPNLLVHFAASEAFRTRAVEETP